MRFEARVRIEDLTPQLVLALVVAEHCHDELTNDEMVVTSVDDSSHGAGSLHPLGRAADLRTRDLHPAARPHWSDMLDERLRPLGFDVVLESDHLHIEWDPRPEVPQERT